jgi:excinuclease ABC subunit C
MGANTEKLKQIIADLPQKPGVYQYFDIDQKIIYVGKAKKLKNRVGSYFNKIKHESGKTRLLVSKIVDIKFIAVETEYDALLLENTLIKKHQPRYNILLRDDKTYPWICIKKERFPRVFYTRKLIRDGSDYFGPYASVKTIRTLIELLNKLYKFRTCSYFLSKESVDKKKFKPCLEHHIGNCKAPCANLQSEGDYNQSVAHAKAILKGNYKDVLVSLKEKIAILVEDLKFEQAEEIKQQIDALDNFQSRSTVVHPTINNVDVFSIATDDKYGYVNYLRVMSGAIVQSHTIELRKRLDETEEDLLEMAIGELRTVFNSNSKELFTSVELNLEIPRVELHFPQRGDKKKLIELSLKNAKYFMLDRHRAQDKIDPDRRKNRVLTQIKDDLRLAELPDHIECFDNSNIQGTHPVAACVVFIGGKPAKKMYRKFEIKTVVGPDDFASMEEVVYRRYKRLLDENQPLPQLVVKGS